MRFSFRCAFFRSMTLPPVSSSSTDPLPAPLPLSTSEAPASEPWSLAEKLDFASGDPDGSASTSRARRDGLDFARLMNMPRE
jgi:hypothetical protein